MQYSWADVVEPVLSAVRPRAVVEIGVGDGGNCRKVGHWCVFHDSRLHSIDPFPRVDVDGLVREFSPHLSFHVGRSLAVLDTIGPVDVALIDGDHNWYSVFHELQALWRINASRHHPPPVVVLHDVGWPYGRRDMYLDPELPAEGRHPSRIGGLFPGHGRPEPEAGLNSGCDHADHEGGPRNGIRTAVEDHLDVVGGAARFGVFPFNWGLGVIAPDARLSASPELGAFLDRLESPEWANQLHDAEQLRIADLLGLPVDIGLVGAP